MGIISLRRFQVLLSCLAIAFGDVALTAKAAVAQNARWVMERPKFDELWRRTLTMLQEHDGFVEKEDIERALGIDLQELDASAVNATRYAVAYIPFKLRVEWHLSRNTTPADRAAYPDVTARSSVVIYWYEATFEAFNAGVALGLVRKDLHQAGFFSCPPPSHPQIGASPACFRNVRGGPYPSTIRVDMNAKDPDRRYAIEFYGMTGAEPTK
ncbi:hypothetical protein [uncultured Reyranella sp.]|uniref:hypothetical protein n=1 Tax=uncultured Reyranella sp. TaxID=735512 RepID=UPI0025D1D3AB|nr:hypothetical protein [uncultured Reyranella sp.]